MLSINLDIVLLAIQFLCITDHLTIRYLMNNAYFYGRVIRWLLLLQEFDITILDKPNN
jgi:hypothetical protein